MSPVTQIDRPTADAGVEGVKESLRDIEQAFNERDLEIYARNVTADLLNMTVYDVGGRDVIVTHDRQARLDELAERWATINFKATASVEPTEIYVAGDRAFAIYHVKQLFVPNDGQPGVGMEKILELYLFLKEEPGVGWQTERSMTIVRAQNQVGS